MPMNAPDGSAGAQTQPETHPPLAVAPLPAGFPPSPATPRPSPPECGLFIPCARV